MVYLRFGRRPVAAECRIDSRVDSMVEGLRAELLGFPYLDVLQFAVRLADAEMQELASHWRRAEFVDNLPVKVVANRNILDVGVHHENDLLYIGPKGIRMNEETVRRVGDHVKGLSEGKRVYRSPRRVERAAATRQAILDAARTLFVSNGYTATTVAEVANRAGVSLDTVYAAVGRKPALLRELVETSISGAGTAVPAEQRDYVLRMRAAGSAREMLTIYAHAITGIQQRLAPVFLALRDAAMTDPDCAALWAEISARRAANMRAMAAELRATGDVREDLSDDQVADVIWSMNSSEYWVLLVRERSWSPERFASWLIDAWTRLLLP